MRPGFLKGRIGGSGRFGQTKESYPGTKERRGVRGGGVVRAGSKELCLCGKGRQREGGRRRTLQTRPGLKENQESAFVEKKKGFLAAGWPWGDELTPSGRVKRSEKRQEDGKRKEGEGVPILTTGKKGQTRNRRI